MDFITQKHRQDYAELAKLVSDKTLEELKHISEINLFNDCEEYVDIEYGDIVGTIWKEERAYLGVAFDLWNPITDETPELLGTAELGKRIYLKQL